MYSLIFSWNKVVFSLQSLISASFKSYLAWKIFIKWYYRKTFSLQLCCLQTPLSSPTFVIPVVIYTITGWVWVFSSVISVLKPSHQSWFVWERTSKSTESWLRKLCVPICRVQCGLVGAGGADVRDDGRKVPVRHHHWQSRHEHWRLPLPRYSPLGFGLFWGNTIKMDSLHSRVRVSFPSVTPQLL